MSSYEVIDVVWYMEKLFLYIGASTIFFYEETRGDLILYKVSFYSGVLSKGNSDDS